MLDCKNIIDIESHTICYIQTLHNNTFFLATSQWQFLANLDTATTKIKFYSALFEYGKASLSTLTMLQC